MPNRPPLSGLGTGSSPRYNTTWNNRITLDGEDLKGLKTFTYVVSVIDEHGGSHADVKVLIGKPRTAYLQLKNIWNSKQLSGFSIQMSKQFYCIERKPRELPQPSSTRYKCFLTVAYVKYFASVGQTLLVTTDCGREQTRSQQRKKSGGCIGSG
ncbi:unnamed protein product [Schistosoma guineensis]|nr:unnamed protein product [Schistosoma guineensis]